MAALAVQVQSDRPQVAVAAPADLQQQQCSIKRRAVEEGKRERCVVSREFYQDAKADGWIGKKFGGGLDKVTAEGSRRHHESGVGQTGRVLAND